MLFNSRFSKYKFYNKLLDGVTLLRVTSTVCLLFSFFLPILCFYTCASMYIVFIDNIDEYIRSCLVAIAFLVSLILLII